jgi:SAM-dependent methyltransferase
MSFKDHFSGHAADYATARPGYPAALFRYLDGLPAQHELAWDCGTGSGQAAVRLAESFARVVATDASAEQLAHAEPNPRVEYRLGSAERVELADGSVDLVTVAQALHWFDFDRFYAEVRRVLAPGGGLAAWTYKLLSVAPAIDRALLHFAHQVVGPYWPPERRYVDEEYRTLPFPFVEEAAPAFHGEERWDLRRYLAYVSTWSSVKRYTQAKGDPLPAFAEEVAAAWGDPAVERTISLPIYLRVGRV